jgi:hypothetical protein
LYFFVAQERGALARRSCAFDFIAIPQKCAILDLQSHAIFILLKTYKTNS